MELSNSNIKKITIFSQKKAVLLFQEKLSYGFLYFRKRKLLKFLIFQEVISRAWKLKRTHP